MLAYFLVFIGALLRILPHPGNFAPIAALALFGGVYLNKRQALWLPLAAMFLSDIFIGFDSLISRATVYGSFCAVGLLGLAMRRRKNLATIAGGTLLASLIFYLITNFAYFYPPVMYGHDLNGVISSYINALPFFRNTVLGDFFYVSAFFGIYEAVALWQSRRVLKNARA